MLRLNRHTPLTYILEDGTFFVRIYKCELFNLSLRKAILQDDSITKLLCLHQSIYHDKHYLDGPLSVVLSAQLHEHWRNIFFKVVFFFIACIFCLSSINDNGKIFQIRKIFLT